MNTQLTKQLFTHQVYKDKKSSKSEDKLAMKDAPKIIDKAIKYFYRKDKTISKEDVEDTVMDVVMLAIMNKEEDITEEIILGRVRSRLTKLQYTNVGLTVRGTVPANGQKKLHIRPQYDKSGDNLISRTADKYMPDPSQVAILEEIGAE